MREPILLLATGKSGLGHLRRLTNIAEALSRLDARQPLILCTNSPVAGLAAEERTLYAKIDVVARENMATHAKTAGAGVVVVDTAVVPGVAALDAGLCLVLRETVSTSLSRFRLPAERMWDVVLVPNPEDWWRPPADVLGAKRVECVGWIHRRATLPSLRGDSVKAIVLVASGGGGTSETAASFSARIDPLLSALKQNVRRPFEVVQALGPRAGGEARLAGADRVIDPGGQLNDWFARSGLVVSTAGYNSVLELADLDVPVLLVPIDRTHDDQSERARRWAPRLGAAYEPEAIACVQSWASDVLERRARRPRVDLGTSGAAAAARAILGLAG